MFWIGVLYFSEGFPLGVFYDVFPVHFRQQGVELWEIGFMSLLGLAWTLKFLWAPAIDHYRHHRRWMSGVDLAMAVIMLGFALHQGFGPWAWLGVGLFTLASATNDIAIDGYTIELLEPHELGLANGLRIAFYRVGMLSAGMILIFSDWLGWSATYVAAALLLAGAALVVQLAPRERPRPAAPALGARAELKALLLSPRALALVLGLFAAALWLVDRSLHWSTAWPTLWSVAAAVGLAIWLGAFWWGRRGGQGQRAVDLREGPVFGALMEMAQRRWMLPVAGFILLFKLGDSAMGFMIKPFWVDAGFSAAEIGLVSVNLGLVLSVAGGIAGGWLTDRMGIFRGLWLLGLFQALSNLGYAAAADLLPTVPGGEGLSPALEQRLVIYAVSALESFTGGLGTAAFLAFLMAIVERGRSATEYALLSSVFALSRSVAGWAGGFGAQLLGYAPYFLLTFFLAFPAYALLPWVRRMLAARLATEAGR